VKIAPDGQIFLVDFGLAKIVQGGQVTTTGARAMTPGYSPPEQYGTARTDARTDIYSLGATLYASLTGIIPEDGLARAMANTELTPLRRRNPRISRRLSAVIEKAMAVDPADRYQTADEFKKALLNSKSVTEQQTGKYSVAPPPPEALEAERKRSEAQTRSDAPKPSIPVPAAVDEDKPFVPPTKILLEKQRRRVRRRRSLITFLFIVAAGLVGVLYYNPWMVPAEARSLLTMLVATPTAAPTAAPSATAVQTKPKTFTPQPSATATSTHIPPTATLTRTPVPSPVQTEPVIPVVTRESIQTAAPTVTPMGGGQGELAFASDRTGIPQIYLTDLLGRNLRVITSMPEGACQPSWAPDGKRLAFVSPCSGPTLIGPAPSPDTGLYIINADGTGLTALTSVPGGDFEPAWSPDGKQIAFTSLREGSMQIYKLELGDQSVTRLSYLPENAVARQPAWLPSGQTIIFAARRKGIYQIWEMSATRENPKQIIRSGDAYWDFFPQPSRDGSAIFFTQQGANAGPLSWQMSSAYQPETTTAVRLKLGGLAAAHAAISPDGFWMAFQSQDKDGQMDVYFVMVAGTGLTRLTTDGGNDFDPAWRPVLPGEPPAMTATAIPGS
jgi:Tol biopolymer transport system component